jgi:hypothetical protein
MNLLPTCVLIYCFSAFYDVRISPRRDIVTEADTKSRELTELTLFNRRETLIGSSAGSISGLGDDDGDDEHDTKIIGEKIPLIRIAGIPMLHLW